MTGGIFAPGSLSESAGLAVALVLGLGFGWFLERGGLGNANKLAGQFYLRDFTVLKVMFSAIVTAALGLFWLDRLSLVDVSLVYLPETFILPQAAGGLIFGVGFVMGGLCPGTSCVSLSSGRVDGLALLVGLLVGIFVFNEAFPLFEGLYRSSPRGGITLPQLLGISGPAGVTLLVWLALGAFAGSEWLERRVARQS